MSISGREESDPVRGEENGFVRFQAPAPGIRLQPVEKAQTGTFKPLPPVLRIRAVAVRQKQTAEKRMAGQKTADSGYAGRDGASPDGLFLCSSRTEISIREEQTCADGRKPDRKTIAEAGRRVVE